MPHDSTAVPATADAKATTVEAFFSADRAKAFIDAVVAIAMTLLILPLLEAITSLGSEGHAKPSIPAALWFDGNYLLLVSFLISFAVIAMFWINHHRMFAGVRRVTTPLLWLNMAWLLTIVWLPVATAMTGILHSDDVLVLVAYIGTMALTSLLALVQELYLRAHPELHDIPEHALLRGLGASLAMTVLFLISLGVAIVFPVISYFALFLLLFTGVLRGPFARLFGARRARTAG
nr:TMEM175 family protein [Planctomonas sp. JC2975]